jgi:hypothetical protein
MRPFTLPRTLSALLAVGISLPIAALAQPRDAQSQQSGSQDSSVADAARRSREKKKNAAKSAKVITDEELDKRNFPAGNEGLNVGSAPKLETEPPSAQAVAAAEAADASTEQDAKEAAAQDAKLARLKEQVADTEKDLDLAKRGLALDQDSFQSNPDYSHDAAGKAKLQDEKQQIDDKQQELDRLKAKLAELEERKSHRRGARAQATPSQPETPPSTPPQP